MDSAEILEQKYPLVIWEKSVRTDSEGAGATRGAPGNVAIYGPRLAEMEAHYFLDGVVNRPQGAHGGGSPAVPEVWRVEDEGHWTQLTETINGARLQPPQALVSLSAGGGGYGDPLDRDPELVLKDVLEGWISAERALDPYGVVLSGDPRRWETLAIDAEATAAERARRRSESDRAEGHRRAQERLRWGTRAHLAAP